MTDASKDGNAHFHIFKVSGKWYTSGRGILPDTTFKPYYNPSLAREKILEANGGKMPGLSEKGKYFRIVIVPDKDHGMGWPLTLDPMNE